LADVTKTPVAVLTGFLGSGKTTLLQRLLTHPALGETAVIVNELGEVAIDHHLLRRVDERTVVLGNGCVCCTLRGDLADELRDLVDKRDRGEVPPFRRVVVETTGVADPAPILFTLESEPVVRNHFEVERVITTVDAVHGLRGEESLLQAAAADRLVVTKTDLADGHELVRQLSELNPAADVLEAQFGELDPEQLFGGEDHVPRPAPPLHDHAGHAGGVVAHCLVFDEPLDWTAFGVWLTMLLASRGADVLRVKGLLDVGGDGPLLVNGVQHVVHLPVHLDQWPDEDRRTRIVLIGRGLDRAALEESLLAFVRAARALAS
jgi:G3E family GTPase